MDMGRIRTKLVKRLTLDLIDKAKDRLSKDFEENKKVVTEMLADASKKTRNTVAGYATRLMKQHEEY